MDLDVANPKEEKQEEGLEPGESLSRNLKIHNGGMSNKCNQCDFVSSHAGNLKRHLKTHSGEKSNKCNQCDFASSQAGNLRTHLKHRKNCECCPLALLIEGSL